MYICKYIYRYSHPLPRRPSGWLYFAALASMMAKRSCLYYATLFGLTAAIRIHCPAGPAAVVPVIAALVQLRYVAAIVTPTQL